MRRRQRIGDILLSDNLVAEGDLERAVALQETKGGRLGQILLDEGLISPVALLKSLARQFGVDLVDLDEIGVDPAAARMVPPALARRRRALPIAFDGETLVVAMSNPTDVVALDDIRAVTSALAIRPVMAETGQLQAAISRWSPDGMIPPESATPQAATAGAPFIPVAEESHIRFVDGILAKATAERASDVHLEPVDGGLRVRFRVDGVMHDVMTAPAGVEAGVVSRLKVLGGMDIGERRLPQDGRVTHAVDGRTVDLRIATVPTIRGEAAVVRLLDPSAEIATLERLGLSPANLDRLRAAIARPYGLILATGPTGAGKTTTLYAALRELNHPQRNVITVEDPVEVALAGAKQVQVNVRAGLTFASALRSFLRADPDVVMIGEIRDVETATIAAEASLTGHLVLSSIHTNDAAATPLRLLEMGVEPFLVASSLHAVVAQRLARRLCTRCRHAFRPSDDELAALGWDLDAAERPTLHQAGPGCPACDQTGYHGRVAVHELLVVDDELAAMIGARASVDDLRRAAVAGGMRTLRQDGLEKVAAGVTGVEELSRTLA